MLKGEAKLEFQEGEISLKEGDYITIPSHLKHRVSFTSKPAVWLAIFFEG